MLNHPRTVMCVGSTIRKEPGGHRASVVLFLEELESGAQFTKYFNVQFSKQGNPKFRMNSDFLKLYRITMGKNPVNQYHKVKQLIKHLHNQEFEISYTSSKSKKGELYNKVTKINPIDPIVIEGEWSPHGLLLLPKRKRFIPPHSNHPKTNLASNY